MCMNMTAVKVDSLVKIDDEVTLLGEEVTDYVELDISLGLTAVLGDNVNVLIHSAVVRLQCVIHGR